MALVDVLPENFNYKVIESDFKSIYDFKCTLRSKLKSSEEFKSWLQDFEAKTCSSWNLRNSVDGGKFEFSRDLICQHSSYRKRKVRFYFLITSKFIIFYVSA
jgi:hypothetical protein